MINDFLMRHRNATVRVLIVLLIVPALIWTAAASMAEQLVEAWKIFRNPETL